MTAVHYEALKAAQNEARFPATPWREGVGVELTVAYMTCYKSSLIKA